MMNKMAVQATLMSNALDKEQETEEDDKIDVKEEYLTSEDNADRDFYQQIIKSESISDEEQDSGSRDASEDNNAMDKEQKTEVDDNFDVKKECLISEDNADRDFYNILGEHLEFYQIFIKNESVSDDEQDGDSSDASDNKNTLDKSETNSNTDTDNPEFQCSMCKEVFTDRLTYDTHLRNHINKLTGLECLICNRKLYKNSNLKNHMKSHLGIKDYECTTCNKKFVLSVSLNRHMKTHEGIKEYECLICKKKFSQNSYLQKHMKIHKGIKDYECSICDKIFTRSGALKIHLKIHEGIKDECSICKKKFAQNGYLKTHMKLHEGIGDYKCSICKKTFSRKGHFKIHLKMHEAIKDHECPICKKKLTRSSLKKHMKMYERKNE